MFSVLMEAFTFPLAGQWVLNKTIWRLKWYFNITVWRICAQNVPLINYWAALKEEFLYIWSCSREESCSHIRLHICVKQHSQDTQQQKWNTKIDLMQNMIWGCSFPKLYLISTPQCKRVVPPIMTHYVS